MTPTPTLTTHLRIPCETYDRLRDHAYDLGRSVCAETRLWLEVGAAASVYAASIDPRASTLMPADELDELRTQAAIELQKAMARALPTPVAPDVVLGTLMPVSAN